MNQAPASRDRTSELLARARPACAATAAMALAFSAVMAAGLLRSAARTPPDPQADDAFQALKTRLVTDAGNAALKDEIRSADLRLRAEFYRLREMTRKGAYLLAGASAVMFIAMGLFLAAPPRPVRPASPLADHKRDGRLAAAGRAGAAFAVVLLIGGSLGWAAYGGMSADLPQLSARAPDQPGGSITPSTTLAPAATNPASLPFANMPGMDEIRKNWPRFRGPFGSGVYESNAPIHWNAATGEGIVWKQPLPLAGNSSPIVWGGRVLVTAADKKVRKLLCYGASDGHLLWERGVATKDSPTTVPGVPESEESEGESPASAEPPASSEAASHAQPTSSSAPTASSESPASAETTEERAVENAGYASPSPATDGNSFAAIFPNGDIACFDANGVLRWVRNLQFRDNTYGYASSLDIAAGSVIVQIDQGGAEQGASRLVALDAITGKVRWDVPRPVGGSWSSPIVVPLGAARGGGLAVLAAGSPLLIAHDLATGEELWRAQVCGDDGAPSPILAGGLAIAVNANNAVSAVRAGGTGDVTETGVAWKSTEDVPDIVSPVSDGRYLWTLTSMGVLDCYELAGGKKLSSVELHMPFQASPSIAGGKLYLLSEKGTMVILEAGPGDKEIARCELGERVTASPAFAGGKIFIRGAKHLFCIGN